MTKAQLLPLLEDYMHEHYGYISFEPQQLNDFVENWKLKENETVERIADYFQDSLLSSGECEVQE